jgi:putative FmdB family regulatory protein
MPTYDYVCDACQHQFEEFQSMSEAPLKKCPQCKKKKLRRLIGTGAAILFKGSGFYQTDYRSESYKSAAKAADKIDTNGTTTAAKPADTSGAAGANSKSDGKASAKNTKSGP